MKTLYELLGALPEDDAESIRAAFRRAAKANHPDRNPGDPDAPRKFRRIVRAHTILSDEGQRASYDQLLDIALRQQGLKPKRGIWSDRVRRAVLDTITGAAVSLGVFGAGYLLLVPAPQVPLIPPAAVELSRPDAAQTAFGASIEPSHTVAGASSDEKRDSIAALIAQARPERPEATTPGPDAPAKDAASAASTPDITPEADDPKFYQERGISAYRSGDLFLALADFDLAISLDPGASESYINRAIVYHRMGDLKHAFADVSHAKRIDDSNRRKASRATANAP
jgi:curved DNA-binding protein CbpA